MPEETAQWFYLRKSFPRVYIQCSSAFLFLAGRRPRCATMHPTPPFSAHCGRTGGSSRARPGATVTRDFECAESIVSLEEIGARGRFAISVCFLP